MRLDNIFGVFQNAHIKSNMYSVRLFDN